MHRYYPRIISVILVLCLLAESALASFPPITGRQPPFSPFVPSGLLMSQALADRAIASSTAVPFLHSGIIRTVENPPVESVSAMQPVFHSMHAVLPPGLKWLVWLLAAPLGEELMRRLPWRMENPIRFALKHKRVLDTDTNALMDATLGHYLSLQFLGQITDAAFFSAQDLFTLPVPLLAWASRWTVGWIAGWLSAAFVHMRYNWDRHFRKPLPPRYRQAMGMKSGHWAEGHLLTSTQVGVLQKGTVWAWMRMGLSRDAAEEIVAKRNRLTSPKTVIDEIHVRRYQTLHRILTSPSFSVQRLLDYQAQEEGVLHRLRGIRRNRIGNYQLFFTNAGLRSPVKAASSAAALERAITKDKVQRLSDLTDRRFYPLNYSVIILLADFLSSIPEEDYKSERMTRVPFDPRVRKAMQAFIADFEMRTTNLGDLSGSTPSYLDLKTALLRLALAYPDSEAGIRLYLSDLEDVHRVLNARTREDSAVQSEIADMLNEWLFWRTVKGNSEAAAPGSWPRVSYHVVMGENTALPASIDLELLGPEDRDLIKAWSADDDLRPDWIESTSGDGEVPGYKIVSRSSNGERRLEGWISWVSMGSALFIPAIQIAPWNVGEKGEFRGIGTVLLARVLEQSHELGFGGRIMTAPASQEGMEFFTRVGALLFRGVPVFEATDHDGEVAHDDEYLAVTPALAARIMEDQTARAGFAITDHTRTGPEATAVAIETHGSPAGGTLLALQTAGVLLQRAAVLVDPNAGVVLPEAVLRAALTVQQVNSMIGELHHLKLAEFMAVQAGEILHVILTGTQAGGCNQTTIDDLAAFHKKHPDLKIAYHLVREWIGSSVKEVIGIFPAIEQFARIEELFERAQAGDSDALEGLKEKTYLSNLMNMHILPEFFFNGIRLLKEPAYNDFERALMDPELDVKIEAWVYYWTSPRLVSHFLRTQHASPMYSAA